MKTVGARAAAVGGMVGAVGAVCLGAAARGQAIYIESVQGDLSNNRFAPTPLMVSEGSNQLLGIMGGGNVGGMVDRDYYSITVPQGMVLSQIILEEYFSKDPVAFLAIQPGPTFPNDPKNTLPEELMGWIHLGVEHVGLDVLPLMGMQGQGFTPPLNAGVYSFWAQQLGAPTDYVLDFVVTVPGPGVAWVVGGGLVLMRGRRRR